jgi:hypothetical protein
MNVSIISTTKNTTIQFLLTMGTFDARYGFQSGQVLLTVVTEQYRFRRRIGMILFQ